MGGFVILGFFVVAVLAAIGLSKAKKVDAAWRVAATRLGVSFRPGGLGGRRLLGKVNGRTVRVDVTAKGSDDGTNQTRYRVEYPALNLGLVIKEAGTLTRISKALGLHALDVGDPRFDQALAVQGHQQARVRAFLTPARRDAILAGFERFEKLRIHDEEVEFKRKGLDGEAQLVNTVEGLVALVDEILGETEEGRAERAAYEREYAAPSGSMLESSSESLLASPSESALEWTPNEPWGDGLEEGPDDGPAPPPLPTQRAEQPEPPPLPLEPELDRAGSPPPIVRVEPEPVFVDLAELVQPGTLEPRPTSTPGEGLQVEPEAETEPEPEPTRAPKSDPEPEPKPEPAQPAAGRSIYRSQVFEPLRPDPAVAPDLPADAGSPALSTTAVEACANLFAAGRLGSRIKQDFEADYLDRAVRWEGLLVRVQPYYSDATFGAQAGTRAQFLLHTIEGATVGAGEVHAIVHLPPEAAERYRDRTQRAFTFTGRLVRCDPFMRHLFVADGELV